MPERDAVRESLVRVLEYSDIKGKAPWAAMYDLCGALGIPSSSVHTEIADALLRRAEPQGEEHTDCAQLDDVVREVFCRVFGDDGDAGLSEVERWHEWYKPSDWLWWGRGLGTFLEKRIKERATRPAPVVTEAMVEACIAYDAATWKSADTKWPEQALAQGREFYRGLLTAALAQGTP